MSIFFLGCSIMANRSGWFFSTFACSLCSQPITQIPLSLAPTKALKVGAGSSSHPHLLLLAADRLIEDFVTACGNAIEWGNR